MKPAVWSVPRECWQIDYFSDDYHQNELQVIERLLADEYPRVAKPLVILFERRLSTQPFKIRKHSRVLFVGAAAEAWARIFGQDKPARIGSIRHEQIDVERMVQLKPLLFLEGRRVVALNCCYPAPQAKILIEAGFVVEEQTIKLASTELSGMRGAVRLS